MYQRTIAALLSIPLLVLAACGGDDVSDVPETGTGAEVVLTEEARCEANRDAGTITFLTGFDFAAASSIVEVINADALGFYEELCLDVEIVSSFSTANYPLVAGGQGQFASGGSFSEVVSFAAANDADLVVVMLAGNTPIDGLIVKPETAAELADLAGSTIGVKGKLPASIEVMLLRAGLVDGSDYRTVPLEGFDPTAHIAIDAIDAFPGWKSNEPGRLEREGIEFDLFDPSANDVPGSFGAIFTTRQFIEQHPTAAEDFVRATMMGLAAGIDDPAAAARAAVDLVVANGNPNFLSPEGEVFRWGTEAALIAARTPGGTAPGTPDPDALAAEVAAYHEVGFFGDGDLPNFRVHVDDTLARAVTGSDGKVAWPNR